MGKGHEILDRYISLIFINWQLWVVVRWSSWTARGHEQPVGENESGRSTPELGAYFAASIARAQLIDNRPRLASLVERGVRASARCFRPTLQESHQR